MSQEDSNNNTARSSSNSSNHSLPIDSSTTHIQEDHPTRNDLIIAEPPTATATPKVSSNCNGLKDTNRMEYPHDDGNILHEVQPESLIPTSNIVPSHSVIMDIHNDNNNNSDMMVVGTSPMSPRSPSQPLLSSSNSNACDALSTTTTSYCTTPSSPIPKHDLAIQPSTSSRPKSSSSNDAQSRSSSAVERRLSAARFLKLEKDGKSGVNQSITSLKTPMSSNSKTKSRNNFRIRTCFGMLELGRVKLCNLLSLMVNLVAFVVLSVIIIGGYIGQTKIQELVSGNLGLDTELNRAEMISACRAAAFSNFNATIAARYLAYYNSTYQKFMANVKIILDRVPIEMQYNIVNNISFYDMRTAKAMALESKALSFVRKKNYTAAMDTLESAQYKNYLEGFKEELQPLVEYVLGNTARLQELTTTTMTVCLVVIVSSIVIVIPTVIASLTVSIRKDSSNVKKLKKIKTYLLKDTMRDPKTRNQFKNFCKQELSLDNYHLLEKVNDYKVLCDKSIDIQVYLFDQSDTLSDVASEQSATTNGSTNQPKKKKKKVYTEKDFVAVEKKKYEIAFEIFTDYLDVRGDKSVNINKSLADRVKQCLDIFATGQSEQLPDNLFENVESEICLLLLDTHRRFIASLECQKQNKMEVLAKLKLSKKSQVNQQ
ncbi:hypothetical protein C9374_007673 [Naegleria lovaniensis]|uniref:RGS domain-containing protein n=1 Tax=Naegleria lovaniensis TaxID=51637 RepID=A0AA88GLA8_NAELO|nr:uncharacterized protein C9374_007673 [Naegleria lovaniensis]KAG2379035.1 hypothetical protein C9374_007673 [Naegleria lovaniensis]